MSKTAAAKKKASKTVCIVVPTYREAKNIPVLIEKIDAAMKAARISYEITVVDDNSRDGIIEAVQGLGKKYPVSIKVRTAEKGLSSAVIAGFPMSDSDIIVVMDADLSHPPEKIPEVVRPIIEGKADFVIGSRFVKGGGAAHFNIYRRLNAWVSKMIARPFTRANDPMAGFFGFPRRILENITELNPLGFKIGLELIVKAAPRTIMEIPIQFRERLYGESKLSLKEQVNYLLHIKRLLEYKYRTFAEFIKFCMIGSSGMAIDLSLVFISMEMLHIEFRISRLIGFLCAMTSNFFLNRRFNFKNARSGNIIRQYAAFFITSIAGGSANWLLSVYLVENVDFFQTSYLYLFAAFLGIIAGVTINFSGSKLIVFKN